MISEVFKKLWDSPTFTSWGYKLAAISKALFLLPLVLIQFGDAELACWLMLGTLSFFSAMIGTQTSATCSRMFSMAYGGAKDLKPTSSLGENQTTSIPNWVLINDLYGAVKFINIRVAILGVPIVLSLGLFSFGQILPEHSSPNNIWASLLVFALGQFISQLFRHYWVVLRGFNKVALSGRWAAFISITSTCASSVGVILGGKILTLVIIQQLFIFIEIITYKVLIKKYLSCEFKSSSVSKINKEIFKWAWTPIWKGIVQSLANRGSLRVGILVLASTLDAASLASTLLALRLLDIIEDFSSAPIYSHVPFFGKLFGGRNIEELNRALLSKFRLSVWIQSIGLIFVPTGAHLYLNFFQSPHRLPQLDTLILIFVAYFILSQIRLSLVIALIGNEVVAVRRFFVAFLLSSLSSWFIIPLYGIWGFVISVFLPSILIVNIAPLQIGCRIVGLSSLKFFRSVHFLPFLLLAVSLILYILVSI